MPAQNIIERAFSGGELAPALYARVDHTKYQTGLRTARNLICMRHGGVTQRPGTMYVGTTLNGGNPVRLIPFIFNETGLGQSYMLEFGNKYIAFYQNGAPVVGPTHTVLSAFYSAGARVQVETTNTGYVVGDIITIAGIVGATQFNGTFIIAGFSVPTDTFLITNLDGSPVVGGPAYISGGTVTSNPYRIASPYLQADLATLDYAESADVLTITHPSYQVRELTRLAPTQWTVTPISNWGSNVPAPTHGGGVILVSGTAGIDLNRQYQVTTVFSNGQESDAQSPNFAFANVTSAGFKYPTVATPITLTWDPVAGAISYRVYAQDIAASGTYGFIGSAVSTQFLDNGIIPDHLNTYPQYVQIFGNDGSGLCPAHVGFSQQRRYFSNTNANPIGFWGSQPGAYRNFDTHLVSQDDDAIIGQVAGEEVNSIQHILELKFMLMLTAGAELFVQGNGSGVVTPSSINASVQSQYGSSPLRPIKAGDVVIFNQSLGNFIRDLAFDFVIDGYRGNDLTVFSAHLFEGHQIVDWAYQKIPDSILWAVREDGVLLSLTYVREQQILAWTRHDFDNGGAGNINTMPAVVENVACIPENGNYTVYLSIKRNVNGVTVRYIERMSQRIWQSPAAAVATGSAVALGDPIDATYLDCFSKYDGRNTNPSLTMLLSYGGIWIDQGINDTFFFREPLLKNIVLKAVIPPGSYSSATLATTVAVAMSAVAQQVYTGTIAATKLQINCVGGGSFFLDFTSAIAQVTEQTLGFVVSTYSVTGSITSEGAPSNPFSRGSQAYTQQLTLTSSAPYFGGGQTAQIGDQIFLEDALWVTDQATPGNQVKGAQGNQIRCSIQSVTNSTTAIVLPDRAVPLSIQTALTSWARAVNQLSGLNYLQGQFVSIWADRFMVASALRQVSDPDIATYSVLANGKLEINLPNYYSVIYVGLPMTADFETLAIDTTFGDALLGDTKLITSIVVYLYQARGFWGGTENPDFNIDNPYVAGQNNSLFQLTENKAQGDRLFYDSAPSLLTNWQITHIECNWSKEGRIFIRNVDPVPLSILAVVPAGLTSAKQAWSQKV
jgi:hypothetical protein